jgi:putative ABC transport system ATP-binding protein
MNIIGCLDVPTEGEYILSGRKIGEQDEKTLAHIRSKEIGFIFQSYNLLPTMTALENTAAPLLFRGVTKQKREKAAAEILREVGLGDRMKHVPSQMSGGQQQRVGIARALVSKPTIVFADEPTGNLDSHTTIEVMELLVKLAHEHGITFILVTHDTELSQYADRIITLKDGRIIDDRRQTPLVNNEENELIGGSEQ